MEKPVILVTGATGTTGGELVRLLAEAGARPGLGPLAREGSLDPAAGYGSASRAADGLAVVPAGWANRLGGGDCANSGR